MALGAAAPEPQSRGLGVTYCAELRDNAAERTASVLSSVLASYRNTQQQQQEGGGGSSSGSASSALPSHAECMEIPICGRLESSRVPPAVLRGEAVNLPALTKLPEARQLVAAMLHPRPERPKVEQALARVHLATQDTYSYDMQHATTDGRNAPSVSGMQHAMHNVRHATQDAQDATH